MKDAPPHGKKKSSQSGYLDVLANSAKETVTKDRKLRKREKGEGKVERHVD